jgi:hypothetical protein
MTRRRQGRDKGAPGLAEYLRRTIDAYCDDFPEGFSAPVA